MKQLNHIKRLFSFAFILLLAACDGSNSGFPAPECGGPDNPCKELLTIVTTPNVATVLTGMQQQFKTTAVFSDGSLQDLSDLVIWSVSDTAIATINQQGWVTTKSSGEVMINATFEGHQSNAKLTVIDGVAEQLTIFPASKVLPEGTSQQYSSFVTLMDGQVIDVTNNVTWLMADTSIATIDNDALVQALKVGDSQLGATLTHDGKLLNALAALSVSAGDVSQIVISPANREFPIGSFGIFNATAYYPDGHIQDITRDATWSSANTGVGKIVASGVHAGDTVAVGLGKTNINVSFHSVNATTEATVTDALLLSISINPVDKITAAGNSVSYQAYGLYSDATKHEITKLVAWSVSMPSIANIDMDGVATTFIAGNTEIKASYSGLTKAVSLTVTDATIESLQITPNTPSVAKGTSGQFTAIATYSDKTSVDVTHQANWSTTDTSIAQIMPSGNYAGYAISLQEGTTDVSAYVNGVIATTHLTVTSAVITALSLTPSTSTLPAGTTEQLQLFAIFNDGSSVEHTLDASFQSDNPAALSMDNNGLATAHFNSGSDITITAIYDGQQTTATIRVTDGLLQRIEITPATMSIPVGHKGTLQARAFYSDGSSKDIDHLATWSVDDGDIASVNNTVTHAGDVLGISEGVVTVTASFQGKHATNTTTVTSAILESVSISPAIETVIAGLDQQYTLTAQFSDKSSLDVTTSSDWLSSDNNTATIDSNGLATGHIEGRVTITGTYLGLSADATLNVLSGVLTTIQISPVDPTEPVGTVGRFTAMGFYTDGYSTNLTSSVTWTSSEPSIVSITTKGAGGGQASADKLGISTIKAELSTISATTLVTVINAPIQSIVISPVSADIAPGMNYQYTATAIYGGSIPGKDITDVAHWNTNDTAIATITSTGYAKGESTGVATINATYDGQSATATLNVGAPELDHISLLPATNTLAMGTNVYYQAIAFDSAGKDYVINNYADWAITDTTIAHVDNSTTNGGFVTPLSPGVTQVEVNFLGQTVTADLTVTTAAVTRIEISPIAPEIIMKERQQFTATAFYSDSTSKEITDLASWQSSDTDIATMHSTLQGLASSHNVGSTDISANFSGYSAQTTLTVEEKVIKNIQITPHVNYITVDEQVQLTCSIIYIDLSIGNCSNSALWTIDDSDIAHVEPASGLVTAVKAGNTRVYATYHGVTSSAADGQVSVVEP